MKIFRDNGNYKHSKFVVTDEEVPQENLDTTYSLRRVVDTSAKGGIVNDVISTINASIYTNTAAYNREISGQVNVVGYITGTGENFLELQLVGCQYRGYVISSEKPSLTFNLFVNEDGTIKPTKQSFQLNCDGFNATLTVALCGELKKGKGKLNGFMWDASMDLLGK